MMEIQGASIELQTNAVNSTVNAVGVGQQKQNTGAAQKTFKSTLDKVCKESQGVNQGGEPQAVKVEEKQPDLTNDLNLSPVATPMAMVISFAEAAMPELTDSAETNGAEPSATEVVPGILNAVDATKVLTEATKNQVLGIAPTNTASQVIETIATTSDKQVLETVIYTVTAQGNEEQKSSPIKLPNPEISEPSQLAQDISQDAVEINPNPEVYVSMPKQPVQNAVALKMVVNGKSALGPVDAEPEVSFADQEQAAHAMKTAKTIVALAAKDTFVIAPDKSMAQDQGFEADLAQSTLSVPMPASGKTDLAAAAFPDIEAPRPIKDQVLQQIIQKVNILTNGGQQEINMQLKPDHLGPLNVLIAVENGAVTAKFHTDSQHVKQLLEASMSQLKQELQAQGLKVQQVDVYVGQQNMSFSNFSRQASHYNLSKTRQVGKMAAEDLEQQFSNTATSVGRYAGLQSGGVDYRV